MESYEVLGSFGELHLHDLNRSQTELQCQQGGFILTFSWKISRRILNIQASSGEWMTSTRSKDSLSEYHTSRYLNNPEVMSGAAFFGLALVSGSKLVFSLAVMRYLAHWWFLSRVEK